MKTLVHDELFLGRIKEALRESQTELRLGIVIGLPSMKQSVILHLAPCPPLEKTTDKIELWIGQHAKQVSRMMPGGIDILGVFVFSTQDVLEKQKTVVRQALMNVHKSLAKTCQLQEYPQRCLLHVDSKSFKLTSRLMEMSNINANGSPQDVKLVKTCTNFSIINARVPLSFNGYLAKEMASQSLQSQIASCLTAFEEDISSAQVLIEDCASYEKGDAINTLTESSDISVQFLVKQRTNLSAEAVSLTTCGARVSVSGGVQLTAVVPIRATCDDVVKSIKQDALRNLKSRCAMHCEDLLLIEDEQQDQSVLHELPKRVFLKREKAPSTIPFCDFVFHGDDPNDCLQAFEEILGINVQADDIEKPVEQVPADDTREARDVAHVEEFVEEMISEGAKQLQENPTNVLKIVLACCVPVLAILIAWVLTK